MSQINPLIREFCLEDIAYSKQWVTVSALFDINEVWLALGEQTSTDYTPNMTTGPEDGSTGSMLLESVINGDVSLEDLNYAYSVIDKLDNVYRAKGLTL